MNFLGIIAFVLALLISVMIHEAGHFLTARHYGMKVTEFFLGFGQRLWSFRKGETEFGIKAIPAVVTAALLECRFMNLSPKKRSHGLSILPPHQNV